MDEQGGLRSASVSQYRTVFYGRRKIDGIELVYYEIDASRSGLDSFPALLHSPRGPISPALCRVFIPISRAACRSSPTAKETKQLIHGRRGLRGGEDDVAIEQNGRRLSVREADEYDNLEVTVSVILRILRALRQNFSRFVNGSISSTDPHQPSLATGMGLFSRIARRLPLASFPVGPGFARSVLQQQRIITETV